MMNYVILMGYWRIWETMYIHVCTYLEMLPYLEDTLLVCTYLNVIRTIVRVTYTSAGNWKHISNEGIIIDMSSTDIRTYLAGFLLQ